MTAPIRVGVINDLASGPPDPSDLERWLRFAADELIEKGRIDRRIEFIYAWGQGLPSGTAAAVERAYSELVEQDVLLIVGPAIGDNALVVTPLAERCRIPTINWAGSENARGDYMFHLQVGSHEEEPAVIARYLTEKGCRRIGVIYDESPIGRRYYDFLLREAGCLGLDLITAIGIEPLATDADRQARRLLEVGVDACVYLGLGHVASVVSRSLAEQGWSGERVMNTAGLRGYAPKSAEMFDGWSYVDLHSDGNLTLQALRRRLALPPEQALAAAKGYDLGRLVAEGIARAPLLTADGVRQGLERVKWLPAAQGQEGTCLGFGCWSRGALQGRYLVLRRWDRGRSVELD